MAAKARSHPSLPVHFLENMCQQGVDLFNISDDVTVKGSKSTTSRHDTVLSGQRNLEWLAQARIQVSVGSHKVNTCV